MKTKTEIQDILNRAGDRSGYSFLDDDLQNKHIRLLTMKAKFVEMIVLDVNGDIDNRMKSTIYKWFSFLENRYITVK